MRPSPGYAAWGGPLWREVFSCSSTGRLLVLQEAVADTVVEAPAGERGGRWLRVGVRGGHDRGAGAVLGGGDGGVGHSCQAEGGTAEDSGRDDREGDVASDVVGHFSFLVSVRFSDSRPVCSGDDLRMPKSDSDVCRPIGR